MDDQRSTPETLFEDVEWNNVHANDGFRPARRVLQPRTFTRFSKLPLELRLHIWGMAANLMRVVRIHEKVNKVVDLSEDENELAIQALNKHIINSHTWYSNSGQTQLEKYGFTSSQSQPKLVNRDFLEHAALFAQARSSFYSPDRIPALLHVCRESRDLMISYGYRLAFSTPTAPAGTWFNFPSDILLLHEHWEPYDVPGAHGTLWNIKKFPRNDLDSVRKLALPAYSLLDYGELDDAVHMAVQLFGNLEELMIVNWGHDGRYRREMDWFPGGNDESATVDLEVADFTRYYYQLSLDEPSLHNREWLRPQNYNNISNLHDLDPDGRQCSSFIEAGLRNHEPCFQDRTTWTTPKVCFVVLLDSAQVERYIRGRKDFAPWIGGNYWDSLENLRRIYGSPLPDVDSMTALEDSEEGLIGSGLDDLRQAGDSIFSVRE